MCFIDFLSKLIFLVTIYRSINMNIIRPYTKLFYKSTIYSSIVDKNYTPKISLPLNKILIILTTLYVYFNLSPLLNATNIVILIDHCLLSADKISILNCKWLRLSRQKEMLYSDVRWIDKTNEVNYLWHY